MYITNIQVFRWIIREPKIQKLNDQNKPNNHILTKKDLFTPLITPNSSSKETTHPKNSNNSKTQIKVISHENHNQNGEIGELECRGELEFKNVYFSYPTRPDITVLNGLSFTVKPGQVE